MPSETLAGQFDFERMCDDVAESLRRIYRREPDASYLVFPWKRFDREQTVGVRRVSEQESKILVTQWLQRASLPYSIETPTTKTFVQKGTTAQSALTDVTIYSSDGALTRLVNIELKAGQPGVESFRKDLEKLLQEETPGMWFHTLVKATASSWRSLHRKLEEALAKLELDFPGEFEKATNSVYFYFCVLADAPKKGTPLRPFSLDFRTWRQDLNRGFELPQLKSRPAQQRLN